jgi:hypothetical protein
MQAFGKKYFSVLPPLPQMHVDIIDSKNAVPASADAVDAGLDSPEE